MTDKDILSHDEVHALLDILTHYEVYEEIQDFRFPGALETYGPPFYAHAGIPSAFPSLQSLVTSLLLKLPGLRDVSKDFWLDRLATIIGDLEKAELSESYDKGVLGIRKTLATAISALIEYPLRGISAGFDAPDANTKSVEYDTSDAKQLQQSFKDLMQQCVYGDMLDIMFKKTAETGKLSDHPPLVRAAHEYILVNLASFLHYILIISPKGQQLLALINNANKLIPYTIVRQTLKIGNVASMINAMMKVILAKVSVGTVTNWIGLTQQADEGMNLMQKYDSIIWTVLHWDIRDLKSRASKIEKAKDAPKKEQLQALRDYLKKSRKEHEQMREASQQRSQSIVHVILSDSTASNQLDPEQHKYLLEYLSIHLSIRDREKIIQTLCYSNPDHLTQATRDLVAAYEPIIRSVHNAVDLADTVNDFEFFLRDLIKLSKIPGSSRTGRAAPHGNVPTVGDFVQLLKKHMSSSHKFLHQMAKNDKEMTKWYYEWAKEAAAQFKQSGSSTGEKGAGDLTQPLNEMFFSLPKEKQPRLREVLRSYAQYLSKLHAASRIRLQAVISSPQSTNPALTQTSSWGFSSRSTPAGSRSSSPARNTQIPGSRHLSSLSRSGKGKETDATDSDSDMPNTTSISESAPGDTHPGPGAYLARWQHLLDSTLITPVEAENGAIRGGGQASVMRASATGIDHGAGGSAAAEAEAEEGSTDVLAEQSAAKQSHNNNKDNEQHDESDDDVFEDAHQRLDQLGLRPSERMTAPDVKPVTDALVSEFRRLLAERSCTW